MTGGGFVHRPVLVFEVMSFLKADGGGLFADCTLGLGGHSEKILLSSENSRVIAIDCDAEAVRVARERLEEFGERFRAFHGNFYDLDSVMAGLGISSVDGILLDLGLSSAQLEDESRGFSFMKDAPLDMRMDKNLPEGAGDLINGMTERELAGIFRDFGEEPRAGRIASAVVKKRQEGGVKTTLELAGLVCGVYGKRGKAHPATRVFQALRIAVNRELEALSGFLEKAIGLLSPEGRMCVISYHSLEDRLVKNKFKSLKEQKLAEILTRKPLTPEREEVLSNRRSRSAKLRVLERV